MTDNTAEKPALPADGAGRAGGWLVLPAAGIILSGLAAGACYWAAGSSLGLFFGAIAFAALITPPLIPVNMSLPRSLATIGGLAMGTAGVWSLAVVKSDTTAAEWLVSVALLIAWLIALAGGTRALRRLRLAPPISAAVVTLAAIVWLMWPLWLSPWLNAAPGETGWSTGPASERLVNRLVGIHPLFGLNGTLVHLGLWAQYPIIYRQTVLGQDVAYSSCQSAWPAVVFHVLLGGVLMAAACLGAKARLCREKTTQVLKRSLRMPDTGVDLISAGWTSKIDGGCFAVVMRWWLFADSTRGYGTIAVIMAQLSGTFWPTALSRALLLGVAVALLATSDGSGRGHDLASITPMLPPAATSLPPAPPYLLHLPGVGGECYPDQLLMRRFKTADRELQTEIYDWTCHDAGIPALLASRRNDEQARKIAAHLVELFRANPQRPIYLVCHSGGAGLAAWALEDLPLDVRIEAVLFLAPALSPGYDLSSALAHVRGKAYVFFSQYDQIVLGAGTKLMGTIDGVRTEAAGLKGFIPPAAADPLQYAKLIQKPYDAEWLKYDNDGDHIGPTSAPFARYVLAPLMLGLPAEGGR